MRLNRTLVVVGLIVAVVLAALPVGTTVEAQSGVVATVKVDRLNVRRTPHAQGAVLGVLRNNQQVTAIGRDRVSAWLQVQTTFGLGWIDARFVRTNISILSLPDTQDTAPAIATVVEAKAYVRLGPFTSYPIIYNVRPGIEMDVIGLHDQNTWVQVIAPNGRIGWIFLESVLVRGSVLNLPYTNRLVPPLAKINNYRVRVRALPDDTSRILYTARLGELLTILGEDSTRLWYKVSGPFGIGYIKGTLVEVLGYAIVP